MVIKKDFGLYTYISPEYRGRMERRYAVGYTWEDEWDSVIMSIIRGLSWRQQMQFREAYGIARDEPLIKKNPRTHVHVWDREIGRLKIELRVRNNPIKSTDMLTQYRGKGADVYVHPHTPRLEPEAEKQRDGLRLVGMLDFINHYIRLPLELPYLDGLPEYHHYDVIHYQPDNCQINDIQSPDNQSSSGGNIPIRDCQRNAGIIPGESSHCYNGNDGVCCYSPKHGFYVIYYD